MSVFSFRWHRLRIALLLLALTLLGHLPTLANPGYFNHDELQRQDLVQRDGFLAFARAYGQVRAGPDFGFPVRPIGFLQQGASGMLMRESPLLVHLFDVLHHGAVVLLLHLLLTRLGWDGRRAIVAAALFALSPLAAGSTAWVGASFDRWYVLFTLVAALGALRFVQRGPDAVGTATLLLGGVGAILSKETASMLPAALAVGAFALRCGGTALPWRRVAAALALSSLPIVAYLAIRLPAMLASGGGQGGAYAPALDNLREGVALYFAHPFLLGAQELVTATRLESWRWTLALSAHALLLLALWRRFGARMVLAYLAGYFVFLLPVLPLTLRGLHYLYASALPLALALAALLPRLGGQVPAASRLQHVVAVVVVAWLVARGQGIQHGFLEDGRCQARFSTALDAQLPALRRAGVSDIRIESGPGAREHVARRTLTDRPAYADAPRFHFSGSPAPDDATVLHLQRDCLVVGDGAGTVPGH